MKKHALYDALDDSYKKTYSSKNWDRRVSIYLDALSDATVPSDPLSSEIKEVVHKLDRIYTQLAKDQINNAPKLEKLQGALELKKKMYALQAREGTLQGYDQAKSDDTAKNSAYAYISEEEFMKNGNNSYTLLDLIEKSREREIVLTQLFYTIRNKKELLITDNAMMKLEVSLDGGA